MRYKTLEDLIEEGSDFHAKLSQRYGEFEQMVANERIGLLLDQLRRREESMSSALKNFCLSVPPGALHTWLQFAPEGRESEFLQRLRNVNLKDLEEISALAMEIDIYLADLYRSLLQGVDTPSARDALENLVRLEELEEHTLSMNLCNLRDY
ncbi:MAG: hypothetical protein K0U59_08350 [Gammaproteobacteria bacterium]|nr:hypothetical protein [Gammaproteobacteria bacterium]